MDTFSRASLTENTPVLCFILSYKIKHIHDNIYRYFPQYCSKGGPQAQGIDYEQYSYQTNICVKHISVLIHQIHTKYTLLTIDPVKIKTTIQPSDIGTKGSNVPLLEYNQSYIRGTQRFHSHNSDHNRRI